MEDLRCVVCGKPFDHGCNSAACSQECEDRALGCAWTTADECAFDCERSVAGTDEPIPVCPIHGKHPEVV